MVQRKWRRDRIWHLIKTSPISLKTVIFSWLFKKWFFLPFQFSICKEIPKHQDSFKHCCGAEKICTLMLFFARNGESAVLVAARWKTGLFAHGKTTGNAVLQWKKTGAPCTHPTSRYHKECYKLLLLGKEKNDDDFYFLMSMTLGMMVPSWYFPTNSQALQASALSQQRCHEELESSVIIAIRLSNS